MNIPHEEIRERGDRSWSMRLVEELVATRDEDVVIEICKTMEELDDYRMEKPLFEIVLNEANDDFVRRAAIRGLCVSPTSESEAQRRTWWHSGDEVLRELAANLFDRTEDDLLLEILLNPSHPLYPDAISQISFGGYQEFLFQKILVDALTHALPELREDAARGLVYAEPVVAEAGLLSLLNDPDADVFDGVLFTLSYFSSQNVLLGFHHALQNCSEERKPELESVFGGLSETCFENLQRCRTHSNVAESLFRDWLKPASTILNFNEFEKDVECFSSEREVDLLTPKKKTSKPKTVRPSAKTLMSELDDQKCYWKKIRYRKINWELYSRLDRRRLANFFGGHRDPSVRDLGCNALANWNEPDILLAFLNDSSFSVRRGAAYYMKFLEKNETISENLWQRLLEPGVGSAYGCEVLESFVKHAPRENLADKLLEYIQMNKCESPRTWALRNLDCLNAVDHLRSLVELLEREPNPSWMFHTALIEICTAHKFEAPNIAFLKGIDDFEFQAAFCVYLAERG